MCAEVRVGVSTAPVGSPRAVPQGAGAVAMVPRGLMSIMLCMISATDALRSAGVAFPPLRPPRRPQHVTRPAERRPVLPLSIVMSEDGKQRSPLDLFADASWDLFVMPGVHANSRYDRPLEPLAPTLKANSTFSWGGVSEEQEALRLPTGLRAAERLTPVPVERPRGLWFEVEGRDIKGDAEVLSREWTRLWAVVVVIAVLVNACSLLGDVAAGGYDEAASDDLTQTALRTAQRLRGGALATFAVTATGAQHTRQRSTAWLTERDPDSDGPVSDGDEPDVSDASGSDSFEDRLNALLDRPVFDPDNRARDESRLLGLFRDKFDADPEYATIMYVGGYFALLLCFAQQGVRIYKHCFFMPDKLCPWEVGPSVDELFNF